ncbi:hypothetical protein LOD99_5727 [Oopsacas minuta]|uniref:Uncharacterized protein n=1 Tax=Oopsacas minuta TaxID=111878 RepID=A0AAV7JPX8_9METZ|nr:hypothetical protein LOD99_5727 [Oopsacas minuta]
MDQPNQQDGATGGNGGRKRRGRRGKNSSPPSSDSSSPNSGGGSPSTSSLSDPTSSSQLPTASLQQLQLEPTITSSMPTGEIAVPSEPALPARGSPGATPVSKFLLCKQRRISFHQKGQTLERLEGKYHY